MNLLKATDFIWTPMEAVPPSAQELQVSDGLIYWWRLFVHDGTYYVARSLKETGEMRYVHRVEIDKPTDFWRYDEDVVL